MVVFLLTFLSISYAHRELTINSTVYSNQTSEWSYYALQYNKSEISEGSIRISLNYDEKYINHLVLAIGLDRKPLFNHTDSKIAADFADYNAWKQSKKQAFISMPAALLLNYTEIIIGIGMKIIEFSEFSLTAEFSEGALCPNDCSGNGICNSTQCECEKGFINYNCDTEAVLMNDNLWFDFDVGINSTEYAYFFLTDNRDFLIFDLAWDGPLGSVSITWKGFSEEDLPSEYNYYAQTFLYTNLRAKTIMFNAETITRGAIFVAFINTINSERDLKVRMRIISRYSLDIEGPTLYIFLCLICCISLSWIIGLAMRCGRQYDTPETRTPGVSLDVVNRSCPKVVYRELDSEDSTTICMICLDEFNENDEVRLLVCKHIYHANCIEAWFSSNVFCCICKRDCSVVNDQTMEYP